MTGFWYIPTVRSEDDMGMACRRAITMAFDFGHNLARSRPGAEPAPLAPSKATVSRHRGGCVDSVLGYGESAIRCPRALRR